MAEDNKITLEIKENSLSTPLVSIISLCYNQAKYCEETLDSIYAQTYKNIELILIDDCSADNSVEVVNLWIESHPDLKIKFIVHQQNMGICKSLNEAMAFASGDYVSIIACDDLMMPEKIEVQLHHLLELTDIGFIYSNSLIIDKDGGKSDLTWVKNRSVKTLNGKVFKEFLTKKHIQLQNCLIRRRCFLDVGPFDENLSYEDYDMILRLSLNHNAKYLDSILVHYRKISSGTSKSMWSKHGESTIRILLKYLNVDKETDRIIRNKINFNLLGILGEDYPKGLRIIKNYKLEKYMVLSLRIISKFRYACKVAYWPYANRIFVRKCLNTFKIKSI